MSKKVVSVAFVLVLAAVVFYFAVLREARIVDAIIARNVEARGGVETWDAVNSMRLSGQMDLGQGMHVPYVMEQKRPGKMCLEFEFDNAIATQCVDGKTGWKRLPFRGSSIPEVMTESELREMADATEIGGLLFNARERGIKVSLVGKESLDGRAATKLQVTLPSGAVRWVYVDDESGLDIRLDAIRVLRGKERIVRTHYYDWLETDGLMIPRRQVSQMEGDDESHFLTVDRVTSNPTLDDSRFAVPAIAVEPTG